MIEVRDGSGNVLYEYVHGLDYIDEVLMVFIRDQGWMHVHQDANWNVVALTNKRGHVKETYTYEPYGKRTVHVRSHACDFNNDGQVNASDQTILTNCASGSWDTDCSACDLDGNGSVQNPGYDKTEFDTVTYTTYRMPGTEVSLVKNAIGRQGLLIHKEMESYENRARLYSPRLRQFIQRDPLQFVTKLSYPHPDGVNLYNYVTSNPLLNVDPTGLWCTPCAYTQSCLQSLACSPCSPAGSRTCTIAYSDPAQCFGGCTLGPTGSSFTEPCTPGTNGQSCVGYFRCGSKWCCTLVPLASWTAPCMSYSRTCY